MIELPQKRLIYIALILLFIPYSYNIYFYPSKDNQLLKKPESINGKLVFQSYNCIACHQIYGLGGYIGPDITNAYSNKGPDYISMVLKNGLGKMPKLNVTDKEIKELVAFLEDVDKTGISPYTHAEINWNGTVKPQEK